MNIKKHIPNTITCMNMACGCLAVVMAFQGNFIWSAIYILLAAVFDFFDGMVARLLNVKSDIGKELDSLSDMVSFGLAPAAIIYNLLLSITPDGSYLPYLAFLLAIFSGLRLAKFNVDDRQTCSFIGLPTPANAMFMSSLAALSDPITPIPGWFSVDVIHAIVTNPIVILCLVFLFSYLLVCELPMFSLKFKNLKWADNRIRFVLIISSVILATIFQMVAVPLIIILFILMSIYEAFIKR